MHPSLSHHHFYSATELKIVVPFDELDLPDRYPLGEMTLTRSCEGRQICLFFCI
jgi:hypothetical protein